MAVKLDSQALAAAFPMLEMRDKQAQALDYIIKAVKAGYRDIVIAAPTGVGKTGIGVAVCEWASADGGENPVVDGEPGGYYLTAQKILQKQITEDFTSGKFTGKGSSIKSSSEYPCEKFKNCGLGRKAKKKCKCASCPYVVAKESFVTSHTAITNYPYLFSEHLYVSKLPKRRVIVCDECHLLERQITRFNDLSVDQDVVSKWLGSTVDLPRLKTLYDFVAWIESEYVPALSEKLEAITLLEDSPQLTDQAAKELVDIDQHICKINRALKLIKDDPRDWVYWDDVSQQNIYGCTARPLSAAPFTAECIHSMGSIRIYMSAFPGEKRVFCRSLGLDHNRVAWKGMGSPFKEENRRVLVTAAGSMSKRNVEASFGSFVRIVGKILDLHANERGIIHCNSYQLGSRIVSAFSDSEHSSRFIFPKNSTERETAFAQHSASPNSVIVSPSMIEGFDFADDLARWQVIAKVPYPSLGDAQVVAKKDQERDWYELQTIMAIVQASGRICRNENDKGTTYILDADFNRLYDNHQHLFPPWWLDSVKWPKK